VVWKPRDGGLDGLQPVGPHHGVIVQQIRFLPVKPRAVTVAPALVSKSVSVMADRFLLAEDCKFSLSIGYRPNAAGLEQI
jgi:hypothetical protein